MLLRNIIMGNPSGVDPAIATYGGFLWYRKETSKFKTISKFTRKRKLPRMVLMNSGKPRENTGQMVAKVANLYRKNPKKVDAIFQKIEKLTRNFLSFMLQEKEFSLKDLIYANQRYLEELGVVSGKTRDLIRKIEKIGGAAKITGAGGSKDNSGILICYHPNMKKLLSFVKNQKIEVIKTRLGMKGVQIEKENI